jgi:tyrocidine synthetase-3
MDRAEAFDQNNIKDIFALTPMQQGMLSHYLQSPGGDLYFEQLCLELAGQVERRLFEQAWQVVAEENEMLRTVFHWDKLKQPVQVVLKEVDFKPRYFDLTHPVPSLEEIRSRDRQEKFDLQQPAFRVTLAKIAGTDYRMIITNHHILFDGWSSGIILSEFLGAYHALCRGETPPRSVKTRFREFVKYLKNLDVDAQREFWRRYLDGLNSNREYSPGRQKTGESAGTGNRRFKWDRDRVDRLETFLQTHRLTAAAFLNTAWGLLLQKYNGSRDVVFDTTVSGRSAKLKGIEEMVGLFINTLPLRVRTWPDEPILDVLKRLNSHLQEREAYEHTPLTLVHEYTAGAQQDLRFDSVVVLENYPLNDRLRQGDGPLAVTSHWIVEKTHHDVTLIITLYDGIEVSVTYNERLWPGEGIEGLWHYFMKIVDQMLSRPDRRAAAIAEPTGIERARIIPVSTPKPGQPEYRAPRSELEKKLAVMWAEVLDVDQAAIGIDADFFLFGGHSLKVNLLLAQLHRQLDVKVPWAQVFKTPTIRGLAAYIDRAGKDRCRPIVPVESREYYVSSSAQKRLYMIYRMAPDDIAYNGPLAMLLTGHLDSDRLEAACLQLVRSHESLRTSFVEIDGEPMQRVHDTVEFKIEMGTAPHSTLDSRVTTFVSSFVRPFDLAQAPLLRVGMIRLNPSLTHPVPLQAGHPSQEGMYLLMVDMHHVIFDGISRDVLMKELAGLYARQAISPPTLQYKDFCHWQHRRLRSGELDAQAAFWQARFAEEPPVLNLPLDFPRPASQHYRGARLTFLLEPGLTAALRGLASESEATLFMVVLCLLNILLSKYSGQEDIVVGTAIGGRYHADVQLVIGLLMETMALRNYPRSDKGWAVFLQEVKETTLQAYANQEYPFRELLRRLGGETPLSRNRLFDVMLIVQNQERVELSLPGVTITPFAFDPGISKLGLTMEVFEGDGGIAFELEYSTALFKVETINRLWQHFVHIIEQAAAADGETVLAGLQLATAEEKRQILEDFNSAPLDDDEKRPVPLLWSEQVERAAERVAVVGDSGLHISFRQLDAAAGQLAHGLRQRGCRADTIVALKAERTVAMMLGLLGILKAGAAYLPIDPAYPQERVHYMLADSGARILLTDRELDSFNQPGRVLPVEQPHPANLAYVIYTSGSTGRPRGVLVSHGNLAAYLYTFWQEFAINEADVVVQQASFSFDTFGEEVYPVLLKGGKVAIPKKGQVQDVALLANFIARHGVTLLDCSPLLLNELNRHHHRRTRSLRIIISGGDALKKAYITHLLDFARVYNTYGPTEATICSTYYRCLVDDPPDVPIGRPITNYRIYILDRHQNLLPIGVPGELCISGVGVTLGYLNNPQLTADKFLNLAAKSPEGTRSPQNTKSYILNPKSQILTPKSQPLYRTGDLCRWRPDGNIEFLGRIDHQVKIRGFRIELEEIEKCLLNHDQVKEAVVLARDQKDRNKYLTAYIVPIPPTNRTSRTSKTSPLQLRQYLSRTLPDYMVPAYFVFLAAMPLTVSGKVDRKALPEPAGDALSRAREYAAPRTPAEEKLASVWQEILGLDPIGIEDNFFELGGDSILANRAIARLREETGLDISLRAFFENPCIRSLAENMPVKESESQHPLTIPRTGKQENIPLSFSQERLWFLQQLDQESRAYHVPRALGIRGQLDIILFERTFTEIIRRHEILRTVFITADGRPSQRVMAPFAFKIPVIDWSGLTEEEQRRSLEAFIVEEGRREFDFEQGPMLRVTVLKLKDADHIVISSEHHLVHDGWTQGVMLREFVEIFTAFSQGRPCPLGELPIQYADYALWQRRYMSGERLQRHLDFWQEKLAGLPPLLDLPFDYPRPAVISGSGAMQRLVIPAELARRLETFGKEHEVTLFMTMLAVFKVLLFRYSGLEDLCVGTGIANRRYREIEGMLGMVINTLPLRTQVDGSLSFLECLQRVRSTCLHAYEHEDTPFEKIVEQLQPERSLSYMPIFQVLFSFMDTPTGELLLPGLEIEVLPSHNRSSKFDLNIVVILPPQGEGSEGGEVLVDWEYNTDLFARRTVQQMVGHYHRLLRQIVERPYPAVSTLPMLEKGELQQLVYEWSGTRTDYPDDRPIHELFEQQAARQPDKIAAAAEHGALTYRVLDGYSRQLSRCLVSQGVRRAEAVAVMGRRSVAVIAGLLAILKTGGAYVPIDFDYPHRRKISIMRDAGIRILLTDYPEADLLAETTIDLREAPPVQDGVEFNREQHSRDLAYIMYTSGSTGLPKGSLVEHRNVVRLVKNTNYVEFRQQERILQTGALEFDASTFEIWGALLNGLSLYLADKEVILTPEKLKNRLQRYNISTIWMTCALFNQMLDTDIEIFRGLHNLLVGGDKLSAPHINKLRRTYPDINVINGYGPTENTTFSTTHLVQVGYRENIPIGRPIPNSTVYIVDRYGQIVPIGVKGELLVGGDGVSRGYLNNPELTADKFVNLAARTRKDTRSTIPKILTPKSQILYRTGDMVRWLADGNIEFLGRMDHQVKIRGFRIELAEIESRLLAHPGIREAVVIARPGNKGDKAIIAYIVPLLTSPTSESSPFKLREYLSRTLPDYMIPAYFVELKKMPLTANGKVDRRALPEPRVQGAVGVYTPPANETERRLAAIWSHLLGIAPSTIDVHTSFFALGGHSLNATLLSARIHKEMKVRVPLVEIFSSPTIRELSALIRRTVHDEFISIVPTEEREYYPLSSPQRRLYVLQQMDVDLTVYNVPTHLILEGSVDRARLKQTFQKLIDRHESLRTSFRFVGEEPVQQVHRRLKFEIDSHDSVRPFDLSAPPLLRVGLVTVDESHCLLMLDTHHIVTDGISMGTLVREFVALYRGEPLPLLRLQYRDYVLWQERERQEAALEEQQAYWLKALSGDIPLLNLPTDFVRPAIQSFSGSRFNFFLEKRQTEALKGLSQASDATLFMTLLALFTILLSRLSGQEDIVVGTPIAGRRHADLQPIVGMFVNTLALRNYPVGAITFIDFLKELKSRTLTAFDNQEYPFEDLVERLNIDRNTGRNPLFDVMFAFQDLQAFGADIGKIEIPGLTLTPLNFEIDTAKFDLNFIGFERNGRLFFSLEYCTALFKQETVERFVHYFKQVVSAVSGESAVKIGQLEIISDREKNQILYRFNNTGGGYVIDQCIHRLFEAAAAASPDHLGLVGTELTHITYGMLNGQAYRLARLLKSRRVERQAIVAIKMRHSIDMVVGLLGILKVGAVFLPLDPDYPEARVQYMLADSCARMLLTDLYPIWNTEPPPLQSGSQLNFLPAPASSLAYCIYTSGSSGRPKGVGIEHRSLVNLCRWHNRQFAVSHQDRATKYAGFGFDASVWEIFPYLAAGASLHIIDEDIRLDIERLILYFERQQITIAFLPTQICEQFMDFDCRGLRILLTGGDKLKKYAKQSYRLVNNYGPTENTVVTTSGPVDRDEVNIPIGKPIMNSRVYILDGYHHIQPVGVPGELCIAGDGLARGYLNNPELTADKFFDLAAKGREDTRSPKNIPGNANIPSFQHSIIPQFKRSGSTLYRTGDLARFLADGSLEFLGRLDQQVKVRGNRVELAEIESKLLGHPAIKEAVVTVRPENQGDKAIIAYIVPLSPPPTNQTNETSPLKLREYLSRTLPAYMIPSHFIFIDCVPLTVNGKVDIRALPEPAPADGTPYAAPRDEIEEKLVGIWSELLAVDRSGLGIDADFFHLGGHSLKATRLSAIIHRDFNVKIPLLKLFQVTTIRGLAQYTREAAESIYASIQPLERREYYAVSSAQKRMFILNQLKGEETSDNTPLVMRAEGKMDKARLEEAVRRLIRRHEPLRTSFAVVHDTPVQVIHPYVELEIRYGRVDSADIARLIRAFIRPFDLSRAPLFRLGLFQLAREEHLLLSDMHHIIADGTSLRIFVDEFIELYNGGELARLRIQYKDFTLWQNNLRHSDYTARQEAFWLAVFPDAGDIPPLSMPTDFPRPPVQSFEGESIDFDLGIELSKQVQQFILKRGATLYMFLLSAYAILLARCCEQEDIVVGTPIAGRPHADLQNLLGMFVNTLPIRLFPAPGKTFDGFLDEVKWRTLQAYENQDYQFEELVNRLGLEPDPGRQTLFDTMFVVQNTEIGSRESRREVRGLRFRSVAFEEEISQFDIITHAFERAGVVTFKLRYCTRLFKHDTIRRLIGYFKEIITAVVDQPDILLKDIALSHGLIDRRLNVFEGEEGDFNL